MCEIATKKELEQSLLCSEKAWENGECADTLWQMKMAYVKCENMVIGSLMMLLSPCLRNLKCFNFPVEKLSAIVIVVVSPLLEQIHSMPILTIFQQLMAS